ncbi:hypothetical protein BSL78_22149 [Apostichopus japonicus]|uniref:PITH domain-containing protein n=1 Tax=Stichopus japonicus TaxID=307972 RepID=A0A2G8JZ71_STIJA|nr:hypothetical protein BSL78_22149 [Apostichopus japonicus]
MTHVPIDLLSLINKSQTECLNESDDHTLSHCLTKGGQYLESDCDEQGTLDFDKAERGEPTQTLELTKEDVVEDAIIPLKFVKFQNVQSVTLFIKDNLGGEDITRVDFLSFIGTTVISSTNMGEFKRVYFNCSSCIRWLASGERAINNNGMGSSYQSSVTFGLKEVFWIPVTPPLANYC